MLTAKIYTEYLKQAVRKPSSSEKFPVVYFIVDEECRFVKIGKADSMPALRKRLATFQTGNPGRLKVVAIRPNSGLEEERQMHELYAEYHHQGEWYRLEGKLEEAVDRYSIDYPIEASPAKRAPSPLARGRVR